MFNINFDSDLETESIIESEIITETEIESDFGTEINTETEIESDFDSETQLSSENDSDFIKKLSNVFENKKKIKNTTFDTESNFIKTIIIKNYFTDSELEKINKETQKELLNYFLNNINKNINNDKNIETYKYCSKLLKNYKFIKDFNDNDEFLQKYIYCIEFSDNNFIKKGLGLFQKKESNLLYLLNFFKKNKIIRKKHIISNNSIYFYKIKQKNLPFSQRNIKINI